MSLNSFFLALFSAKAAALSLIFAAYASSCSSVTPGAQTLNASDQLYGGGGTDTLNATILNSVTPALLSSIEVIDATFTAAQTLNLLNAANVTHVNAVASTFANTISKIAAGAALGVSDTASSTTFQYATTSGTQSVGLTLSNVTGGTTTIAGVETVSVTSTGAANTNTLDADTAGTLNFGGAVAQTITLGAATLGVSLFDASLATGTVKLTVSNDQSGVSPSTNVSVFREANGLNNLKASQPCESPFDRIGHGGFLFFQRLKGKS